MFQRSVGSCPKCSTPGRRLEASSNQTVTYYRCDRCGHVWADVHSMSGAAPRDVTIDPDTPLKRPSFSQFRDRRSGR
jgi:uncharacterized Zn finger protein